MDLAYVDPSIPNALLLVDFSAKLSKILSFFFLSLTRSLLTLKRYLLETGTLTNIQAYFTNIKYKSNKSSRHLVYFYDFTFTFLSSTTVNNLRPTFRGTFNSNVTLEIPSSLFCVARVNLDLAMD